MIARRTTCSLFEHYPALRSRLPWLPLLGGATPVEPLSLQNGAGAGLKRPGPSLWLKRDDRGAEPYGGNKPRKLEWLLADALRRGASQVLTAGGIGSNHALATALYGAQHGLKVHLLLFPQPVTEHVRMSLRLYAHLGAVMHLGGGLEGLAERLAELGGKLSSCYTLPMGGSTHLGCLGFVDAAFELADQVRQGLLPCPTRLFVAGGTCGTLAGLILGTKLAGLRTRVTGVRVVDRNVGNPAVVLELAEGALRILRDAEPSAVPRVSLDESSIELLESYYGDGYGCPTVAGEQALYLLKDRAGIELESTYTAKTLAAVLDACDEAPAGETVLFWNTFAGPVLAGLVADASEESIPPAFRKFLAASGESPDGWATRRPS
jgi:D-cysteine desulfhydrase